MTMEKPITLDELVNYQTRQSVTQALNFLEFEPETEQELDECLTTEAVLERFKEVYEDEPSVEAINNKNLLMRYIIEKQVKDSGGFTIIAPFKNVCKKCHGLGELYRFFKKSILVECNKCEGSGRTGTCEACNGSGRYIRNKPGVNINIECRFCEGTGKNICRRCFGNGKTRIMIIEDKIKSTTFCDTCEGKGYVAYQQNQLQNPVINKELGEIIRTDDTSEPVTEE